MKSVIGNLDEIRIDFSKGTLGRYESEFRFRPSDAARRVYTWQGRAPTTEPSTTFALPEVHEHGELTFEIEGCLAFQARVDLVDIPF